jgi:hypothetical protein
MGIRYLRPHKVIGRKGLVVFQASKEAARAELPSDFHLAFDRGSFRIDRR